MWTDYEYEETQAKLDVADMILETLAEEMVEILKMRSERALNMGESFKKRNEKLD